MFTGKGTVTREREWVEMTRSVVSDEDLSINKGHRRFGLSLEVLLSLKQIDDRGSTDFVRKSNTSYINDIYKKL